MQRESNDGLVIRVTSEGGLRRLTIGGELDLATSPQLATAVVDVLAEAGVTRVVLDLAGLGFCDSVGITTLITAQQRAHASGIHLAVVRPTGMVETVLVTTGLHKVLVVADTGGSAETPETTTHRRA